MHSQLVFYVCDFRMKKVLEKNHLMLKKAINTGNHGHINSIAFRQFLRMHCSMKLLLKHWILYDSHHYLICLSHIKNQYLLLVQLVLVNQLISLNISYVNVIKLYTNQYLLTTLHKQVQVNHKILSCRN